MTDAGHRPILVVDTNIALAAVLPPDGRDKMVVSQVRHTAEWVQSPATAAELRRVVARPLFDRYLPAEERAARVETLLQECRMVDAPARFRRCRDPDDNMFLDLAVAAGALAILSEDRELLRLNPFQGVAIWSAGVYLRRQGLKPSAKRRGG